jgi:competence protein ComEC
MHLAVLSGLIAFFLKPVLGLRWSAAAGFILILGYVYLAGAQPSLVRAALMYGAAAVAVVLGLPRRPLSLLSLAFLVQLVLAPQSAASLSLILSYLALAGILTVGSASEDLLRAWIPDAARPALAASLGAFLATAAVSAACFGALRPVSLVASLALGPAATVLMVGSLSWLAAGAAFPAAAPAVAAALTAVWKANGAIAAAAARVPAIETPSALPVLGISLAVSLVLVYGRYARNRARNRLDPIS